MAPLLLIEDPRYAELRRLNAHYEHETGQQGFIYPSSPGAGPTKFVFRDKTCLGIRQALAYARALGAQADQHAAARRAADTAHAQSMEDIT